jgi:hypothetical protein
MSKWVCRHGTLGEGHENGFDVGLVYPQALREIYNRLFEVSRHVANVKKSKAKLIRAQRALQGATNEADKLDAEANLELANLEMMSAYDCAVDLKAQLDEFQAVANELQDEFRKKYPEGLEQAQPIVWKKVLHYRLMTNIDPKPIPLPQEQKANIGAESGRMDLIAAYAVSNPQGAALLQQKAIDMLKALQDPKRTLKEITSVG